MAFFITFGLLTYTRFYWGTRT